MKDAVKPAIKAIFGKGTGGNDDYGTDRSIPGPGWVAGTIRGTGGAEAAADRVQAILRQAGYQGPTDYAQITSDIKDAVKNGISPDQAVGKVIGDLRASSPEIRKAFDTAASRGGDFSLEAQDQASMRAKAIIEDKGLNANAPSTRDLANGIARYIDMGLSPEEAQALAERDHSESISRDKHLPAPQGPSGGKDPAPWKPEDGDYHPPQEGAVKPKGADKSIASRDASQNLESQLFSGQDRGKGEDGFDWAAHGQKGMDVAKNTVDIKSAEAAESPPPPAQEQNASAADPRAAAIIEMAKAPLSNPGEAALVKPVESWTEPEMKDALGHAQAGFKGWRSGDPLKAHAYEKVQDWHTFVYGDDEQRYDGGKPVEPVARVTVPEQPTPSRTPQGEDLYQAAGRIGQKVADAAGTDGIGDAVKGLQRGLNLLGRQPLPARSPAWGPYTKQAPLVEDGKYGPKTDFALKHAVGRLGAAKVDNALAVGRFNTFARQARSTGNLDGLEQKTHAIFGPLFRDTRKEEAPKVEGGVFQETLNRIGGNRYDDWQPLKVDNWIGPKTTAAFGRVLQDEDADTVTTAFGRGLGLL